MPGSLTVPLKVPLTGDRRTSKYSATEGEGFAVVSFVEHFRPYLCGNPFTLEMDHWSF